LALKDQFTTLKNQYDINQKKLKMKLVTADVLIAQKEQLDELEKSMAEMLYDINAKAVEMDALTGGGYGKLLGQEQLLNPNLAPSPFKAPSVTALTEALAKEKQSSNALKGTWTLTPVAEGMTESFGIVLQGSDAGRVTAYQVLNSDGVILSEKLPVKNPFIHLNLVFSNTDALVVNLYDSSETVIYKGTLDGYGGKGQLLLKPAN